MDSPPFSAISWLWRGLRGSSVTFSLLFACLVLGWSIPGSLWSFFRHHGMHWLFAFLIPIVVIGWLAKREETWLPDPAVRKRYARIIIASSIVLAILINQIRH